MKEIDQYYFPGHPPQTFWTEEKCFITVLFGEDGAPNVSLAIATVKPGVTTQLHALDHTDEVHIIRQGKGLAEINHMLIEVTVGDKVFVPKGVSQRVTNTGTKDLEFYCICLPRFVPDCYINLDNAID